MSHSMNRNYSFNSGRLVIVSNRLPISLSLDENGEWNVKPSSGGLVTALTPVLHRSGGLWLGWPGAFEIDNLDGLMQQGSESSGYTLKPVTLTEEDINLYYLGFSNEVIWPLFHDLQSRCNFEPRYWSRYQEVNTKFAEAILYTTNEDDYIWVQDYHLMLVAKALNSMGEDRHLGFFSHIPFPPPDIYAKMPWRLQILRAMLEYDLIGFQTMRDRNNFIHCIELLMDHISFDTRRQVSSVILSGHETKVGVFPISIDYRDFAHSAASDYVRDRSQELIEAVPDRKIVLGVDRLDYSKGIPERLRAYENLLERFENIRGRITLIQVVVPSRTEIPEYNTLKKGIEEQVSRINGRFAEAGWIPVNYMFRSLERRELLAYYRAADIALITSLKDGMNLVAKEYCAANTDSDGVLILSEFAGSAAQLHHNALMVNPYDIEGVANAIYRAYHFTKEERQLRMRRLRRTIARRDIYWWVDSFLQTAQSSPASEVAKEG